MNLLFIGDVMGAPGQRALTAHVGKLREQLRLDVIVANAENVADGCGITAASARGLFDLGIDVLTNGNHAWDKREALEYIQTEPRLLRPLNYPTGTPGAGYYVIEKNGHRIAILSVLGALFMQPQLACPFRAVDEALAQLPSDVKVILVDMHAETTSEKTAMGWHLDGRVSAVVGTHTHIPTADERVLPKGTAYITDVGMAGCYDSVIGLDTQKALKRLVQKLPERFDVAEGKGTLCGVVIDIDEATGRARSIRRLALEEPGAARAVA